MFQRSLQSRLRGLIMLCFNDEEEYSLQLTLFAETIERDSILYIREEPMKLYYRVVQFVKSKCGANTFNFPNAKTEVTSRSIAQWYYDNQNFSIIEDPRAERNLIQPGSVMFFGKSGVSYEKGAITIENMVNSSTRQLQHIGLVTAVQKDEEGQVVGYTMLHDRRSSRLARRSFYHSITPPREGFPILGNWDQQWIAIAQLATKK